MKAWTRYSQKEIQNVRDPGVIDPFKGILNLNYWNLEAIPKYGFVLVSSDSDIIPILEEHADFFHIDWESVPPNTKRFYFPNWWLYVAKYNAWSYDIFPPKE